MSEAIVVTAEFRLKPERVDEWLHRDDADPAHILL